MRIRLSYSQYDIYIYTCGGAIWHNHELDVSIFVNSYSYNSYTSYNICVIYKWAFHMNIIESAVENDLPMSGVQREQNWLSGLGTIPPVVSRGCGAQLARYADQSVRLWILLYFVIKELKARE